MAEEFFAPVAEEGLGLGVDEPDDSCVVDDDHGVRCRLQQSPEPFLRRLAFADVAYGGGDEQAVRGLQGAEADLDGELGAVLAQSVQLQSGSHGADLLVVGVAVAVVGVMAAEAAGYEEFDGVAEEFFAPVAEKGLGLGVDEPDDSGVVDDDHGVRCRLQQTAKPFLGRAGRARGYAGTAPARHDAPPVGGTRLHSFGQVTHFHSHPETQHETGHPSATRMVSRRHVA